MRVAGGSETRHYSKLRWWSAPVAGTDWPATGSRCGENDLIGHGLGEVAVLHVQLANLVVGLANLQHHQVGDVLEIAEFVGQDVEPLGLLGLRARSHDDIQESTLGRFLAGNVADLRVTVATVSPLRGCCQNPDDLG